MSKKCKAYSRSGLGLELPDSRKAFYAGWDAALAEQPAQQEPVTIHQFRKRGCSDWYDGLPDHHDGHGPYEVRTLYTTPQPPAQPQEFYGVLPFGSTPTEPGLWLSFNDGRIYVWQETGWIEAAHGITKGNT